jgi:salicylate hydroxylase
MDTYKDAFQFPFAPREATTRLRVIIVGAGIAGLSAALGLHKAGHNVTIVERVREIAEVGAGIQMAPNAARILGRFGILEEVVAKANVLERNSLRRYEDVEELGTAPLMPQVCLRGLRIRVLLSPLLVVVVAAVSDEKYIDSVQVGKEYNAPLCVLCAIHRGDLQSILLTAVRTANIDLRLNRRVVSADAQFSSTVHLASGESFSADVVIAADGIKSDLRHQIATAHGHIDHAQPTGDAAYRILIPKGGSRGRP